MRQSQAVRFIPLPIAAGLAVALVVACTNDSPTAPAKFSPTAPAFTYTYIDETDGACPKGGYRLTTVAIPGTLGDSDDDGFVCRKGSDGGDKKNPPKK